MEIHWREVSNMSNNSVISNEQQEFFISQIETTKKIVETFSNTEEFSPAMLINSLLSLVILPFECAKKKNGKKIFPGKFVDLMKKLSITPSVFVPIKICSGNNIKYNNKTIYVFVNKFRNGIAHQNLTVDVDEHRHIHITVMNKFSCSNCKNCKKKYCEEKGLQKQGHSVVDFKIRVTVEELQKIALYIANAYLRAITS